MPFPSVWDDGPSEHQPKEGIPTFLATPVRPTLEDVFNEVKAVRLELQQSWLPRNGAHTLGSAANGSAGAYNSEELHELIEDAFTKERWIQEHKAEGGSKQFVRDMDKILSERLRDHSMAMCEILRQVVSDQVQSLVLKELPQVSNSYLAGASASDAESNDAYSQIHSNLKRQVEFELAGIEDRLMKALPVRRRRRLPNTPTNQIVNRSSRLPKNDTAIVLGEEPLEHEPSAQSEEGNSSPGGAMAAKKNFGQATASSVTTGSGKSKNISDLLSAISSKFQITPTLNSSDQRAKKAVTTGIYENARLNSEKRLREGHFHIEWMQNLLFNVWFRLCWACCILANSVFIGIRQTSSVKNAFRDHNIKVAWDFAGLPRVEFLPDSGQVWDTSGSHWKEVYPEELAFVIFFTVVVFLRFLACPYWFARGAGRWYNLLDSVVCAVTCIDMIVCAIAGHPNHRVLPNLTFFLVVSVAHEITEHFPQFLFIRLMVKGVFHSSGVVWSVVILMLLLCYFFAIILLDGVFAYLKGYAAGEISDAELQVVAKSYGSVPMAVLFLIMSVSGGTDWRDVLAPLSHLPWIYTVCVCFFFGFAIFGVLNVVTGIFVDFALTVTQNSRKEQIRKQLVQQGGWESTIKTMFKEADKDGSGTLSWEEFSLYMEHPVITAYFQSLELDFSEAKGLFTLLDISGTGEISGEDFVQGCCQLKGEAKALDLASLRYEFLRFARLATGFMNKTAAVIAENTGTLNQVFENTCAYEDESGRDIFPTFESSTVL